MLSWIVQLGYKGGASAPTPTPSPAAPSSTPAGKAHRRRYYVEIDGQQFQVSGPDEAVELLQRARAIAEQQAEKSARKAERYVRRKRTIEPIRVATPSISVSPEIREAAAPFIADIGRLYRNAAIEAELRLLLLKQRLEDDDEDELLLLM